MSRIELLDQVTIDKIAAGEVIERPASIVKELVENAIDAGSTSITVEIEGGGISLIRITDNGHGIAAGEVPKAFLRHSTSKIRKVEDLDVISTLGFRGEALSSIAAVSKVELITKVSGEDFGTQYIIEGAKEVSHNEVGATDGTTFIIRQLFYNLPARKKFLKSAITEAGHVQDLLIRLALSNPEISFTLINNKLEKLRTYGNGKLKDVIYSLYGRDIVNKLIEINYEKDGLIISGFIGKPEINRGNRNYETFFVNGRYIKSSMISKSIEDAYKSYVMQHKFPFAVLHFTLDGALVDVNVHPTKMELRFQNQNEIFQNIYECIHRSLLESELIPEVSVSKSPFLLRPSIAKESKSIYGDIKNVADKQLDAKEGKGKGFKEEKDVSKEITGRLQDVDTEIVDSHQKIDKRIIDVEQEPSKELKESYANEEEYYIAKMKERVAKYHDKQSGDVLPADSDLLSRKSNIDSVSKSSNGDRNLNILAEKNEDDIAPSQESTKKQNVYKREDSTEQISLFEEKLLKGDSKPIYQLIGQVFDTYWLVTFGERLYIIDQHAAHEKVLYEQTLNTLKTRQNTSQQISPPVILNLSMLEADILKRNMDSFTKIGFELEPFGGDEYALRAVPGNLFSIAQKELFTEMLDSLSSGLSSRIAANIIDEKIALLACKAAVKGNQRLSTQEVDKLIEELLTLENPYYCPHGRPTIIAFSKRDLEKKFKRIV